MKINLSQHLNDFAASLSMYSLITSFPNILLRNPSLLRRTFLKLSTAFVERSHHSDVLASTTDETEI